MSEFKFGDILTSARPDEQLQQRRLMFVARDRYNPSTNGWCMNIEGEGMVKGLHNMQNWYLHSLKLLDEGPDL